MHHALWLDDGTGTAIYANSAAVAVLGTSDPALVVGRNVLDLVERRDADILLIHGLDGNRRTVREGAFPVTFGSDDVTLHVWEVQLPPPAAPAPFRGERTAADEHASAVFVVDVTGGIVSAHTPDSFLGRNGPDYVGLRLPDLDAGLDEVVWRRSFHELHKGNLNTSDTLFFGGDSRLYPVHVVAHPTGTDAAPLARVVVRAPLRPVSAMSLGLAGNLDQIASLVGHTVFVVARDGIVLDCRHRTDIWSTSVVGSHMPDLVDPARGSRLMSAIRAVLGNAGTTELEMWMLTAIGPRTFRIRIDKWRHDEVVIAAMDISDSLATAERSLSVEAEKQALLAAVAEQIFILDEDGRYIEISSTAPDNFFMDPRDVIGRRPGEILPARSAAVIDDGIARIRSGERQLWIDIELPYQDGIHYLSGSMVPYSNSRIMYAVTDITERVLASRRNASAEALAATAPRLLGAESFEVSASGMIGRWWGGTEKPILGPDSVGRTLSEVIDPELAQLLMLDIVHALAVADPASPKPLVERWGQSPRIETAVVAIDSESVLVVMKESEAGSVDTTSRGLLDLLAMDGALTVVSKDGIVLDYRSPDRQVNVKGALPAGIVLGTHVGSIFWGPLATAMLATVGRAIESGQRASECVTVPFSGESAVFRVRSAPLGPDSAVCHLADISTAEHTSAKLGRIMRRRTGVVAARGEALLVLDEHDKVVDIEGGLAGSKTLALLGGLDHPPVTAQRPLTLDDVLAPELAARCNEQLDNVRTRRRLVRFTYQAGSPTGSPVEWSFLVDLLSVGRGEVAVILQEMPPSHPEIGPDISPVIA